MKDSKAMVFLATWSTLSSFSVYTSFIHSFIHPTAGHSPTFWIRGFRLLFPRGPSAECLIMLSLTKHLIVNFKSNFAYEFRRTQRGEPGLEPITWDAVDQNIVLLYLLERQEKSERELARWSIYFFTLVPKMVQFYQNDRSHFWK